MSDLKESVEKLGKKVTGKECKAPSLSRVIEKIAEGYDNIPATITTTAPTQAISDGGVHLVILDEEPETKYDGYIYFISEE